MRASNRLTLSLAACFFAATCLACSRSDDKDPGRVLSPAELARVDSAVAEYQARMNREEFGQVWDNMLTYLKGDRDQYAGYLSWIHQRYGAVSHSAPIRAIARPSGEVTTNVAVECWYETQGEKGKYVENFLWHLRDDNGTKLVEHRLYQYDENGRLYMTMTLHTGLGPKDVQTSKVMIGSIERNVR